MPALYMSGHCRYKFFITQAQTRVALSFLGKLLPEAPLLP